jgi:hypothetical protein
MLAGLYFSPFRFHLRPLETLRMPAGSKSNVLRGALGIMLDGLRHDGRGDAYSPLFRASAPPGSGALSNYQAIPRPFIIRPPLDGKTTYRPGEELAFELVLVGQALQFLPLVYLAVGQAGLDGLGPARAHCLVTAVEQLGVAGDVVLQFDPRRLERVPRELPPIRSESLPPLPDCSKVTVRFLTPTHLVFDERTVTSDEFEFHHLVKRLRDRVNALATFYCGGPLQLDFAGIGQRAEAVGTIRRNLRWEERVRRSSRTGQRHEIGGLVGECEFEGDLNEFLPLLQLGQYLHVGKHAAWGNGWLQVEGH